MALGLLLWVSWISFLLFDGSAGSPAVKGSGYPYRTDSRNIGADGDDETVTFDQSDWQASNNQPTVPVHTSDDKPSVAERPVLVPSRQNQPNRPGAPEVERLVNGGSRDWGLGNLEKPLRFPLQPVYQPSYPAKPQPGPVQPSSTSLGAASTDRMPDSPAGGSSLYRRPTAHYKPALSSPSQAAKSPNFESWKREPVSSGNDVSRNPNQDSRRGGSSNIPHLVYERVFQYPNENTGPSSNAEGHSRANYVSTGSASRLWGPSFPSFPTNFRTKPAYPSGIKIHQLPQKTAVKTPKIEVNQRVSKKILPPSSYIVQSRNGYQRAGYLLTHSKYSPEFPSPMPVNSKGIKGQPAAPKGAKNPQRTKL